MSKCLNACLRPESKPSTSSGCQVGLKHLVKSSLLPDLPVVTSVCRLSVTGVTTALMVPRVSACWQGAGGGFASFSLQILPASKTNLRFFFLQSTVNVRSS